MADRPTIFSAPMVKTGTAVIGSIGVLGAVMACALTSDFLETSKPAVLRLALAPAHFVDRDPPQPLGLFLRAYAQGRRPQVIMPTASGCAPRRRGDDLVLFGRTSGAMVRKADFALMFETGASE